MAWWVPVKRLHAVILDLETTGRSIHRDQAVQLAAVFVRDWVGGLAEEARPPQFNERIRPSVPISPAASQVHGIYDRDVAGAARIHMVLGRFLAWIATHRDGVTPVVLVAHNGRAFDFPILLRALVRIFGVPRARQMLRRHGIIYLFDTLQWLRSRPGRGRGTGCSNALGDVHRELAGEELTGAHDALADVVGLLRICRAPQFGHPPLSSVTEHRADTLVCRMHQTTQPGRSPYFGS